MRKQYLDNLRYLIVLSVIFYHVIYMFNTLGIIRNVTIEGIPAFDTIMYVLYPWFMAALFLISGISARYALVSQTMGQFLKSRCRRLLLPSIAGIFLIGWIGGWITNQYNDMFVGNGDLIPGFVKYLIYCFSGIGPLWYVHQLMLAYLVLALICKLDKKERLLALGAKTNLPILLLFTLAVWGSAQILNTPLLEIYRHGIYIFMFLLGYHVFSHDNVQELVTKWCLPFTTIAGVLGVVYTITYWGQNFTLMVNLKSLLTNVYAWFAILALLGLMKKFLDKETAFTRYMRENNFAYYVLHYPLMVLLTFIMDKYLHIPMPAMYFFLLVAEMLLLPLVVEIVKRLPIVKTLLLGR